MKKQVTTFLATALLTSMAFAQMQSTTNVGYENVSSRGVRVALIKPILEAEVKISAGGRSATSPKEKLDRSIGLSVGYANLPIQELGWTANLSYLDIGNSESTLGMLRVDGNLAYALSELVNLKGGLNLSKFVSNKGEENRFDPGVGLQAGLGLQVAKNIGIDLGYSQMRQSLSEGGAKAELIESGLEIGLNGTF